MADVFTIDELNALTTLTATDEVPVWDKEESGEPTKKITASNLAASVKSLASLPNTTEMNTAIEQRTAPVRTGAFTPNSTNITTGEVRVVQRGKICEVHLYLRNSAYINAGADFYAGKISGIAMPPQFFRAFCGVGEQPYNIDKLAYLNITTAGEIHIVAQARWVSAVIHLVYTVD